MFDWTEESRFPIAWPNATWASKHGSKKVSVIGIKVWRDRLLLTLPRWSFLLESQQQKFSPNIFRWYGNHHPLNLATVKVPKNGSPSRPELEAFPSWEMQTLGDCSAIQFVQSMQVSCRWGRWGIQRKALRWTRRPRWSGFLTMAENSGLARATPVLLSIDEKSGNNSQKETLQKSNGDFNGTSKYMENY